MKKNNIYNNRDINHFNKLSKKWWDKEGDLKTLHSINPVRLKYIEKFRDLEGKMVLDIGCGGGILSFSMAEMGAQVVGIDPSKKLISIATERNNKKKINLKFLHITLEKYIKSVGNKFDIITCMELIEHVENPYLFVRMIENLLSKNGLVFFSTINRNYMSYLKAIMIGEYILNIIPKGTHSFKKFIKPSELNNMLRKANCDLLNLQGFKYNIFTNKTVFCDDISLNYLSCFKYNK